MINANLGPKDHEHLDKVSLKPAAAQMVLFLTKRSLLMRTIFNPEGKAIGFIKLPERCANLAFRGPKKR